VKSDKKLNCSWPPPHPLKRLQIGVLHLEDPEVSLGSANVSKHTAGTATSNSEVSI
jgi:hypothetical protein